MISLAQPTAQPRAWQCNAPLAIALGALVLTAVLFWPTSVEIADLWQDTVRRRYTHGWLVLGVTVWLIWRDRARLRAIDLSLPTFGWCVVAIGSLGWLVGFNAGLLAMTTLALPLLALATIWAAAGAGLARRVAFPVLYLYFAFPVWELVNPLLQSATALVNVWLTRIAGIPVTMADNVIQIPAGTFEIAGGCSGLHFFIVALAIAALQGELDRYDWRTRWTLLGIAAALALVTNWLRVFIIIVAGQLTEMQHFLVKVDHYYFGWFLFVFALGLYLYLSSRVANRSRSEPPATPSGPPVARTRTAAAAAIALAALALGPAWSLAASDAAANSSRAAPPTLAGWTGPGLNLSDWRPLFANPDDEFLATYVDESGGEVALYQAVYRSQRQGKELRGHGNSVLGANYLMLDTHLRELIVAGGAVAVTEHRAAGAGQYDLLVWSLFAVDGDPSPMDFLHRLDYGIRSLRQPPAAGVVAFAAQCRPDCDSARRSLEAAAVQALPVLLSSQESGRAVVAASRRE